MTPQTTILIVDDEVETRNLLQEIMEKEGYLVWAAQDGKQALDLLEGQAMDLVLSDIQMPLMNGIELLGNIRSRFPDTQVILLTAARLLMFTSTRSVQ